MAEPRTDGLIELTGLPMLPAPASSQRDPMERAQLERRARLLAWGGNVYQLAEFAVALAAGIAAGSIALIASAPTR